VSKVNDAAFSLDGRYLVTGSDDSADVWDMTTQARVLKLQTPAHEVVKQVAFSANGQWIATLSGTIISVWNARTGQLVQQSDDEMPLSARFVSAGQHCHCLFCSARPARIISSVSGGFREQVMSAASTQTRITLGRSPGHRMDSGSRSAAIKAHGYGVCPVRRREKSTISMWQHCVCLGYRYSPSDPLIAMSGESCRSYFATARTAKKWSNSECATQRADVTWQNLTFRAGRSGPGAAIYHRGRQLGCRTNMEADRRSLVVRSMSQERPRFPGA